ncbi:hypothetical protein IMCC3317_24570 [Kordia antarctica]|uniref:VWFA domain-containing protein n=1 Tax=Kordia antarctica TaxID=1218801 RepID=A0A7L4ZKY4_9FLAO|nr:hypothetical protein [Kordia antarctica]QHI37079.1 hypothetical protein IMCC3317_24570 [Kordia antarctica]
MKKIVLRLAAIVILCLVSCKEESKEDKKEVKTNTTKIVSAENKNLNISLLLDLSDRINPEKYPNSTMDFYKRDVAYIKSVSEAFITHLQNKKVRSINDKIQLYFDPEPGNQNINALSQSLRYEINRSNVSLDLLEEMKQAYATKPAKIYELAIKDNAYVGSDTWRFFKNKINDFCILEDHRNILIILTDGYIYHKNTQLKEDHLTSYLTPQLIRQNKLNDKNWKEKLTAQNFGFIAANENLAQLEILVLGINPDKKNPYEEDVIHKYWNDWFRQMKVGQSEIKTAILPSNMDKIIKDFILQ